MKYFICLFLFVLVTAADRVHAQIIDTIKVEGDHTKFYPVKFYDGARNFNIATELEIGRTNVHTDSLWRGSLISTFRYHTTGWGNGSSFIDADIKQANPSNPTINLFIAGWRDMSVANSSTSILVWMRGNTTYYLRSNYPVLPVIFDGVHNPIPYQEPGGPLHSFKTVIDNYVNVQGMSRTNAAYFNGTTPSYFAGNVGIGTPQPLTGTSNPGLHISKGDHSAIFLGDPMGAGYGGVVQTSDTRQRLFLGANLFDDPVAGWRNAKPGKGGAGISIIADNTGWGSFIDFVTSNDGSYTRRMTILGNGNVGIGTTTPGSYKLAVEGTIGARKVKVTQQTNWADFVFEPEYELPSLQEVEAFVRKHKHLPDIPSAKEVAMEGVDLGEMNRLLLQKVEEQMLYIIELNRKIELLSSEIQALKK
ncbi:hypothetical protein [Chitinophaga cymbidii]|nr:hypothetical protein [Chitinophaga cymbidii]